MMLFHHRTVCQQIRIGSSTVLHAIIGSGIHTVPCSIYLHIIPHMQVSAAVRLLIVPLHQNALYSHGIQNTLYRSGISFAEALPLYQGAVGSSDMSCVSFAAIRFKFVDRIFQNGIMGGNHLLFDRLGLFCLPGDSVYFGFLLFYGILDLLFPIKTLRKINAFLILCSQISPVTALLISLHRNGKC